MDLNSTQFIYGILSGMLPSLLWLWFWLKENNLHPEPRSTVATCFFFGMVAVLFAIPLQWIVGIIFADDLHRYVIWAFIEEILKFGVVYVIVIRNKKMDEPLDAMIYMLTAALGFAALENTFFMLGAINGCGFASTIVFGNLRFIGATLLHIISSSVIGFTLALSFYHRRSIKVIAGLIGITLAGTLHVAFNLAIISGNILIGCSTFSTLISDNSSGILKAFGWVWSGVVLLVILFEEVKAIKAPANAGKSIK